MSADRQFASFEICGRCCELRGPFDYTWKGEHFSLVQECRCERDGRPDGERPERWIAFDFNRAAELCHCCGAELLRSGSRWSVWFCGECRPRAVEFNDRVGGAIVPIGRHSMMHSIGMRPTPALSETNIGMFVARFGHLVQRMQRLDGWCHEVIRRNLGNEGLDAQEMIALATYLGQIRNVDRAARFDGDDRMVFRTVEMTRCDADVHQPQPTPYLDPLPEHCSTERSSKTRALHPPHASM